MHSFIRKNNLLLSLIGSSYKGVSVNDVIFSGRQAVEELFGVEDWRFRAICWAILADCELTN